MHRRRSRNWAVSARSSFILFRLLCSIRVTTALSTNRTIDDENGDSVTGAKPNYGPAPGVDPNSTWIQGTTCVHCSLLPGKVIDISQTVDGTWHDSTYHPGDPDHTITASFIGTAIYAFFIVPNTIPFTTTFVNLSFSIDGVHAGQYEHTPDSSSTVLYQVLAFHTTNLENSGHEIEVRATGPTASVIVFDNFVYTFEEADPTPISTITSSSQPVPPTSSSQSPSSSSQPTSSSSQSPTSQSPTSQSPTSQSLVSQTSASQSSPGSQRGVSQSPNSPDSPSSTSPGSQRPTSSQYPPGSPNSQPVPLASHSQSPPLGAIVGGVVGGVAALSLLLALYCCLRKRHRALMPLWLQRWSKKSPASPTSTPRMREANADRMHPESSRYTEYPSSARLRPAVWSPESYVTSTSLHFASEGARSSHLPPITTKEADAEMELDIEPHVSAEPEESPITPPRSSRSPSTYAGTTRTGSSLGSSTLRAEVAGMREELERLRREREMHALFLEPPPCYEA